MIDSLVQDSGQRLLDLGLAGVVILVLIGAIYLLWQAREGDRKLADARYEKVQESRITEQRVALDAVGKAIASSDATREGMLEVMRSHQQ